MENQILKRRQSSIDLLIDSLQALGAQTPSLCTKIGILRLLYPHIKSAKHHGYSYGLILDILIENGFDKTTPNHFYGLLNRLRLENVSISFPGRPTTNNQLIPCIINESTLYLAKTSNVPINISSQSRSNSPTVQEMKFESREFDIDPNAYD
jgi:hypothetical protein